MDRAPLAEQNDLSVNEIHALKRIAPMPIE